MTDPITFPATTTRHALPMLFSGQSQKEASVNEALLLTDLLLNPVVVATIAAPPAAPVEGQCWIIGATPSGAFTGKSGAIAAWTSGGWRFIAPFTGLCVHDLEHGCTAHFDTDWRRASAPAAPSGGTVVDSQARTAIAAIVAQLVYAGIFSTT